MLLFVGCEKGVSSSSWGLENNLTYGAMLVELIVPQKIFSLSLPKESRTDSSLIQMLVLVISLHFVI